jgi:hypothetical protein
MKGADETTLVTRGGQLAPPSDSLVRALNWVSIAVFTLTFLKGFRLPNRWVATHFAFNYSQGFVRRGFLGEVGRFLGVENYKYHVIIVICLTVLALVVALSALAIKRSLRDQRWDWPWRIAILVFLSSPALVFFVHAVGYHDYFGVLFALLLLLVARSSQSRALPWLLAVGMAVLMAFIHEGLSIMFGPVVVFGLACHLARLSSTATLGRAFGQFLLLVVGLGVLMLAVSGTISTFGQEDLERVQALESYVRRHVDFTIRPEAFEALARSSAVNIKSLMPWYWSDPRNVRDAWVAFLSFLPGFLWLISYGAFSVLSSRLRYPFRASLLVLYLAASLAPLLMNFVGWDWSRWNGIAFMACFLSTLAIKLNFPLSIRRPPPWVSTLGAICVCVGLASAMRLFDGVQTQFFPFDGQWYFFRELLENDFAYHPRG